MTYVISDLNGEDVIGVLYKKELQKKLFKKNLGQKKLGKKKGNKLHVKRKEYDTSLNSWIDNKNVI